MTYIIESTGMVMCEIHAHHTARTTGRDLDGFRVETITKADALAQGFNICCERCGK
jgi:hypothetical protein